MYMEAWLAFHSTVEQSVLTVSEQWISALSALIVSLVAQIVEKSVCNAGDLGQEDALEKGMATYSSILAWRIPWTEEPGGL